MSIQAQAIQGVYRKTKDYVIAGLLMLYFGASWVRWERGNGLSKQAIMIDLPNRKAYFFSIVIGPDEAYYITGILVMAALGLFFFTTMFGRLWCGYTCVHTVFVDIFRKIERYFQGDRNSRIQLNSQPMDKRKLAKKACTHFAWLSVSFAFAFGWVCYFYDAHTLWKDLITLHVNDSGEAWLCGLTISTYIFAGYAREKVCMHMCPYGRFQSAMIDNDTSIVTYHSWRGEPRGHLNKVEPNAAKGDCINCYKCVLVCPMGIDIRDGLQMACIGCGLCIDACNSVMSALSMQLGLIAYDSINSAAAKRDNKPIARVILKFKPILFLLVFIASFSAMGWSLAHKAPFLVSMSRPEGPLITIMPDGSRRNTFQMMLVNKQSKSCKLNLSIVSLYDAELMIQGDSSFAREGTIELASEESKEMKVFIKIPEKQAFQDHRDLDLVIKDNSSHYQVQEKITFIYG